MRSVAGVLRNTSELRSLDAAQNHVLYTDNDEEQKGWKWLPRFTV